MGKLTALAVRRAGPGRHGDGDGLSLVIDRKDRGYWYLRVQVAGRSREMCLGSAAALSLADARVAAAEARAAFKAGRDPRRERAAAAAVPTFAEAAALVHAELRPGWRNAKHAAQWMSSLETYALPALGAVRVDRIASQDVRDCIAPIALTIPATARRVLQRIATVLDHAHAQGWRETEAPLRSVKKSLPRPPRVRRSLAALPWAEVPAFLTHLAGRATGPEAQALAFAILTAARTGEVLDLTWGQIDMGRKVWTVRPEGMKMGRAHKVPLSAAARAILVRMMDRRIAEGAAADGHYVFWAADPRRPLNRNALLLALRACDLAEVARSIFGDMAGAALAARASEATVHGFRSAFRDWCAEAGAVPREVAEACLAHKVRNATEAAYARTDHFALRVDVMDRWAAFCLGEAAAGLRVVGE